MNDALLEFGRNVDLRGTAFGGVSLDLTAITPWPAAFVYLSDTIPIAPAGGVGAGTENMFLMLSVTEDFAETTPPCIVTWRLISVASDTTLAAEALAQSFNIHWSSGPTAGSQYLRGNRPFIVPMPPLRNYKAHLAILGTFNTGLNAGKVHIRLTNDIDSGKINPFPNAI